MLQSPFHFLRWDHEILYSTFLGDGSVQLVDPSQLTGSLQLTGAEADAIYRVGCHGNVIYTACRDGCIRKYIIDGIHC